jgi:hypothetical protein
MRRGKAVILLFVLKWAAVLMLWAAALSLALRLGMPVWMLPPVGFFAGYMVGEACHREWSCR